MRIKICGLTKPCEAEYLNEAKADYAGFVFYEKSKRNITASKALKIMERLNPDIKRVAVSVSPDVSMIEMMEETGFDILQIHKELSLEVLKRATLPIWYAVNVTDEDEYNEKISFIDKLPDELSEKIKAIVVDAPDFGSGRPFNWKKSRRLLKAGAQSPPVNGEEPISLSKEREFILAGGLRNENIAEGIKLFSPDAVDVSSGVEGEDGKDRELILKFCEAVRNAE